MRSIHDLVCPYCGQEITVTALVPDMNITVEVADVKFQCDKCNTVLDSKDEVHDCKSHG